MRVLDLFSGIGGFSLGLERAGFETVAFCEIDPFCQRVLRKHWPNVPIYEDVRTLTSERLRQDGIAADVITGGFPCQDITNVSRKRAGMEGKQSGLWSEFSRLIREVQPQFAIVENAASLCVRGLDRICGDLAAIRYDAEWEGIPAAALGAPHLRARQWVLAYPRSKRFGTPEETIFAGRERTWIRDRWATEPKICRVDDGTSNRVGQHHALGNAVVPDIPELIGRAILEAT